MFRKDTRTSSNDFLKYSLLKMLQFLVEMLGLSHLSKQELLSLLKDRNDVCDGVDEFISELEAKESDDREQRLEEEMRLQEEEEERQRQELMNNDLYGDDNGDACATVEDEGDAEIDEEWLAEERSPTICVLLNSMLSCFEHVGAFVGGVLK